MKKSLENDPHEGGTFSYIVSRNGQELNHTGTYRTIERPSKLVFTWGVDEEAGDESVVTIQIEAAEQGCKLSLWHELHPKWEKYIDRTSEGWSSMLNTLKKLLLNQDAES